MIEGDTLKYLKDSQGNITIEAVGFTFKILVVTIMVFQLSIFLVHVGFTKMAIDETVRKAESEGMIREDYLKEQLSKRNISYSTVRVVDTKPTFYKKVDKLGDQLFLKIKYEYKVKFGDFWNIKLSIPLKASGTNQGYYGSGYGEGWWWNMNNIRKLISNEKGSASLVALIKFFLLIVVIGLGIEFVKIQAFHKTLNTKVEIIAQDSLEMNLLDEYRREHISLVKAEDVKNTFYDQLKTEFDLDNSLNPIGKSMLSKQIYIRVISVEEGDYARSGSGSKNTIYPSIHVEGYTEKPIVLLSFLTKYNAKVVFKIDVENSRYD